jgi:hypothetical protein
VRIRWFLLPMLYLLAWRLQAQELKKVLYLGGMGGIATLSGDGSAVITPSSASTSLFDPDNGGAGSVFAGIHLFRYVSFQADYIWNRNHVTLVSSIGSAGALDYYKQPEDVTQQAFLADVLIYFRKRGEVVRPYLSEGLGGVLVHNSFSSGAIIVGNPTLPLTKSDHASIALRTLVGIDLRLRDRWCLRYSFGETISRNTYGDQLVPPQNRTPMNFQNLFGAYFEF